MIEGTLRLEEVESDAGSWRITFSYQHEENDPYGLRKIIALQQSNVPRVYKVVEVDPSGNLLSVKMRE